MDPPLAVLAEALGGGDRWAGAVGFPEFATLRGFARAQLRVAIAKHAEATGAGLPVEDLAGRPLVITGHQVEFYHAGVWAKVVAADALARRVAGAVAIDLLVDHDVVDELGFEVPVREGDTWRREAVTWGAAGAVAADGLLPPDAETFQKWDAALARHEVTHVDAMAMVLAALQPREGEGEATYTQWMSRGRQRLEAALGVHVHHVPTSLVCQTEPWLIFVNGWIQNAAAWTDCYNRHLGAYRTRMGITSAQHPMPDLQRRGEVLELPFWVYATGSVRQRMFVRVAGPRRTILLEDREVDVSGGLGEITVAGLVIRPRALTLTMYVRLFLADVFIHGIGGALYDQITDGILNELFGVVPSYGVVSAAWLLPLGEAMDVEAVSALRHRRHHVVHNPQLAIDPFTALKTDVAELIRDRRELVEGIGASLREDRKGGKAARREMFRKLHAVNAALHEKSPRVLGRLDEELAAARRAMEENKVLLWREWYFALHGMERLRGLMAEVATDGRR